MLKMIRNSAAAIAVATASLSAPTVAQAGANPFIGEMMLFGGTFCPRGWSTAEGQLLPISSYSALFSILGTNFGGDGRSTFGLPDLRGRVPLSQGTGPGLSPVRIGEKGGVENVTVSLAQMPSHNHAATATSTLNGTGSQADAGVVAGNSLARTGTNSIYNATAPAIAMAAGSVATAVTVAANGGGQPVAIRNPYLGMQWCIALEGVYPSRS